MEGVTEWLELIREGGALGVLAFALFLGARTWIALEKLHHDKDRKP